MGSFGNLTESSSDSVIRLDCEYPLDLPIQLAVTGSAERKCTKCRKEMQKEIQKRNTKEMHVKKYLINAEK